MKSIILIAMALLVYNYSQAQVFVNTYANPQVAKTGMFGKTEKIAEDSYTIADLESKIISLPGLAATAKAKEISLTPFRSSVTETKGDNIVLRHKVTAHNAASIRITFDKLHLPENAELYLYTPDGKTITGAITDKENIGDGNINKVWSSNTFEGNSVILELKVPKNELRDVALHVSKVMFGLKVPDVYNSGDSVKLGSFNASNQYCHVNVLCPAGNAWQTERKAVCLIEFTSGNVQYDGSGMLINNTCGYLVPYILTAYHVEHGFNAGGFTFLFNWWSSTCTPNTNTTQSILFNGATFKADYQPTDFGLLQLNQTPSSSLNLSFLGWDRSGVAPTSETGIHHPMGDQMKISSSTNAAYIGNVQGSTNTGWRLVWTSGAVEDGSSGSPLFNQNHQVIGQLYSNTTPVGPPCNQQSGGTNYGRFDLSWTGGGTSSTRLSNWLDPSGSGATSTATANISSLTTKPVAGSFLPMTGTNITCGTSPVVYSVSNVLPGATVAWGLYGPTAGSYQPPVQNVCTLTPNGTQATLTKQNNGNVLLQATITNCDGTIQYSQKQVTFGVPDIYYDGGYWTNGYYQPITGTFAPSNASYVPVVLADNGNSTYTWTKSSGSSNATWTQPTNWAVNVTFASPRNSSTNINFSVHTHNACGDRDDPLAIYYTGPAGFTVSPNPAKTNVTVAVEPGSSSRMYTIRILDNFGTVRKVYDFKQGLTTKSINVSDLKTGTYRIEMFDGKAWQSHQLLIQ